MGFRFRKSVNLGGGFKLNLSKSGIGYSWGTKGVRFTKTAKGKSRTTLHIPGTGLSYSTESKAMKHKRSKKNQTAGNTFTRTQVERSNSMYWIDFLICLFLGLFGVHKFREKRIGLGILYLFTCGLFFVGWIIDCVRYFAVAMNTKTFYSTDTPPQPHDATVTQNATDNTYAPPIKTSFRFNWKWVLTVVLAIFMLVFFPSFASVFALIGIALIIPIPKWQAITEKYVTGKLKSIIAGVLAALTIFAAPTTDTAPTITPEEPKISTAAPAHIHEYQEATCESPKTCSSCGETDGTPLGHAWTEATCVQPKTCTVCDATEEGLTDHEWVDATCLAAKYCAVCEISEGDLGEHAWTESTCLAPKTCSVCNITEGTIGDHQWQDASCTAPMTCSVCGATQGSTIPHTWTEATCTTLKTCSVCQITEGDYGPHSWIDPTCSSPKTCAVCNEQEGTPVDHSYSNHFCVYCGIEEAKVWIPASGSRYHNHAGCSNMNNPTEVYLSTAIARGYTPCGRCY